MPGTEGDEQLLTLCQLEILSMHTNSKFDYFYSPRCMQTLHFLLRWSGRNLVSQWNPLPGCRRCMKRFPFAELRLLVNLERTV